MLSIPAELKAEAGHASHPATQKSIDSNSGTFLGLLGTRQRGSRSAIDTYLWPHTASLL